MNLSWNFLDDCFCQHPTTYKYIKYINLHPSRSIGILTQQEVTGIKIRSKILAETYEIYLYTYIYIIQNLYIWDFSQTSCKPKYHWSTCWYTKHLKSNSLFQPISTHASLWCTVTLPNRREENIWAWNHQDKPICIIALPHVQGRYTCIWMYTKRIASKQVHVSFSFIRFVVDLLKPDTVSPLGFWHCASWISLFNGIFQGVFVPSKGDFKISGRCTTCISSNHQSWKCVPMRTKIQIFTWIKIKTVENGKKRTQAESQFQLTWQQFFKKPWGSCCACCAFRPSG